MLISKYLMKRLSTLPVRNVFRSLLNIKDGIFCENSYQISAENTFPKSSILDDCHGSECILRCSLKQIERDFLQVQVDVQVLFLCLCFTFRLLFFAKNKRKTEWSNYCQFRVSLSFFLPKERIGNSLKLHKMACYKNHGKVKEFPRPQPPLTHDK